MELIDAKIWISVIMSDFRKSGHICNVPSSAAAV